MAKGSLLVLVALAGVLVAAQLKPAVAGVDGGYTPAIQEKVRNIVRDYIYDAPGLVRMVFHDCFVTGCDASVLLNIAEGQNEIHAVQNGGLRGMKVIQAIKDALAADYKYNNGYVKVSCADAIVFAAREAIFLLSKEKIAYDVDGPGRKDSSTSVASNAAALPGPFDNFATLVNTYKNKNFDVTDLVVLSGAHAIGRAHRPTFEPRLNKTVSGPDRGEINPKYQAKVDEKSAASPEKAVANNVRDMVSPWEAISMGYDMSNAVNLFAGKDTLDNSYYTANLNNLVLFNSDWVLRTDTDAAKKLQAYKDNATLWYGLFGDAMYKLSKLTPDATRTDFVQGGARKYCDNLKTE